MCHVKLQVSVFSLQDMLSDYTVLLLRSLSIASVNATFERNIAAFDKDKSKVV